jgi:hypothetical protein
MGLLDRFFNKPAADAQSLVVPQRSGIHHATLADAGLRSGMWVAPADNSELVALGTGIVGILTGCTSEGVAEVTLVKPDGTTQMALGDNDQAVPATLSVPVDSLRQAYLDEIPEPRRGNPATLARMGYVERGSA